MTMTTTDLGRILRALLTGGTLVVLAMLVCGFFGAAVPFFDTMAQFRAHFALLLVGAGLALILARPRLLGGLAAAAGVAGLASVVPYLIPGAPPPLVSVSEAANAMPAARYTLLQMNLRKDASDKAATIRLIGTLSPDVLTMEEASPPWQPVLAGLSHLYPYRYGCESPKEFNDALILSKRPFVAGDPGECSADQRFARRAVDFNGEAVDIVAQHLRWPWPGSQWRQIERNTRPQLESLKASKRPVIVAGDFNAAPWSAALERYAELGGLTVARGIGPSWFYNPLTPWIAPYAGLPIDNVLHSGPIEILAVERQPATDSDHLPVLVTFAIGTGMPTASPTAIVARRME